MVSLVWKDIVAARRILLLVIPLGVLQLAVFASAGPFIFPAALFFSAVLASGSIVLEEAQRTEAMWNSLPASRGQVVFARYLTVLLGIVTGVGLSWAVRQGVGRLMPEQGMGSDPIASTAALAAVFVVLVFTAALYLPFYFRWGAGRGAVILSAVGVGSLLVITLLVRWLLEANGCAGPTLQPDAWNAADPAVRAEFEARLAFAIPRVLGASMCGSLLAFAVSSVASWFLYEARDL